MDLIWPPRLGELESALVCGPAHSTIFALCCSHSIASPAPHTLRLRVLIGMILHVKSKPRGGSSSSGAVHAAEAPCLFSEALVSPLLSLAQPPELEGRSCFGLAGSSAHLTNVSIFRKSKVRSQEKSWAQLKRVALGLMQWQVVTDAVSPPQLTICGASLLSPRKSGSTNAGLYEVRGCGFEPPESHLGRSKRKVVLKRVFFPFVHNHKQEDRNPSLHRGAQLPWMGL